MRSARPSAAVPLWRRYFKLVVFLAVVLLLNAGGSWLARQIEFEIFPRHDALMQLLVWGAALLYVLLMAMPFLPGIEVGLALMMMLGGKGAVLVLLVHAVSAVDQFRRRQHAATSDSLGNARLAAPPPRGRTCARTRAA